ncbi:MAG: TonB-dependent receptor [Bacteroidales bacterium]|nr:TonB-dependent receptor [Bacteroidales bacterium]
MKKVYLFVILMVMSVVGKAQNDDFDDYSIIERDVLGVENINYEVQEKRQVISAARSDKSIDKLPVTVYQVSHQDIVRNGYMTLCDVLKMVPGMRVSQPQSGDIGEAFMQRALLGNTYTKIIINGVEAKPSGVLGMPLGANIPIRQAEHIDIIYGPASASYGNDACTGVINIVTRTPDNGSFTSADVMVGTGNSAYLNFQSGTKIGHGKHVGQFTIYGSNLAATNLNVPKDRDLYNRWNFFLQNGDTLPMALSDGNVYIITRDMIDNNMFQKYSSMFSGMSYYFINWEGDKDKDYYFTNPAICDIPQRSTQLGAEFQLGGLSFSYNLSHRMDFADLGQSPMTYNLEDPHNMLGEYIHRFVASADYKLGDLQTQTVIHYINYRMDKNSSRGVNWSKNYQYAYAASDDIAIEEHLSYKPLENLSLYGGLSYQYSGNLPPVVESDYKFDFDSYKAFAEYVNYKDPAFGSFGINPFTFHQAGAYVNAEYDLGKFSFTAGTRYDYNSLWASSINPRFTALFNATDKFTIRASQGWAYKTPSPAQIYYCVGVAMPNAVPGVPVTIALHHIPSEIGDVIPEHISSTEFGLRYYATKTNYIELVGYTNIVKDPLVRSWVKIDKIKYPVPYYVGVTDFFSNTKGRDWTRAYKNVKDAQTSLYGVQFIMVLKNIFDNSLHFGLSGAVNLSMGSETLSNANAEIEDLREVDYIRHQPKQLVQISAEMDLGKVIHLRLDNIYCSKFARTYYQATDNPYFWAPSYYNLDFALTAKITKNITGIFKMTNVTNSLYGGIDVKNMDVDLPYNPQYLRSLRFGVTYEF